MSDTCQVGILASTIGGRLRYRALALECHQAAQWRDRQVDAEADAERMDGHVCIQRATGAFQRRIPHDRLRTKRDALYSPESALRYLPSRQ